MYFFFFFHFIFFVLKNKHQYDGSCCYLDKYIRNNKYVPQHRKVMPPNTTSMTTTMTTTLVLVTMHKEDGVVRTMRCKDSKVSLKLDRECNKIIILATGYQAKFQVLKRKLLFFLARRSGWSY